MHLVLLNAVGSKVAEQTLKIKKDMNTELLSLKSNLPLGLCTLTTYMDGRIHCVKPVKQ